MAHIAVDEIAVGSDVLKAGYDVFHYLREEVHYLVLQVLRHFQGQLHHAPVAYGLAPVAAVAHFLKHAHAPSLLYVAKLGADFQVQLP